MYWIFFSGFQMKQFTIHLLFLFIFSTNAFAQDSSKIISSKDLEQIETEVQDKLQSKLINDSKKFYINLLAGRELYQYRFYDKAKKYYEEAIKLNVDENKSEAYINLMAISAINENKDELKDNYEAAQKYFNQKSGFKTKDIQYYLSAVEKSLTGKGVVLGFYSHFSQESNLIELIKNKEYEKGLSLLNPEAFKESKNSFNTIVYDILNVNVNKKKVKALYCAPEYKKFPTAYTYSTLLCGLLSDYLTHGKIDEKKYKRAQKYFAEENQEKKYLLEALEGIR